eukprot:1155956-Pelagomonas_calceolata.AAC.12
MSGEGKNVRPAGSLDFFVRTCRNSHVCHVLNVSSRRGSQDSAACDYMRMYLVLAAPHHGFNTCPRPAVLARQLLSTRALPVPANSMHVMSYLSANYPAGHAHACKGHAHVGSYMP